MRTAFWAWMSRALSSGRDSFSSFFSRRDVSERVGFTLNFVVLEKKNDTVQVKTCPTEPARSSPRGGSRAFEDGKNRQKSRGATITKNTNIFLRFDAYKLRENRNFELGPCLGLVAPLANHNFCATLPKRQF